MRKTILLIVGAAVLLPACATRREELRADRRDVRQQTAECRGAKAYGSRGEIRDECRDARDARQELREDRNEPR